MTSDLSKVSSCVRQIKTQNSSASLHFPLRLITAMFSFPLSLPPFFSPSILLLFFIVVVAVLLLVTQRSVSETNPPARGFIPCLPRLPVLGSLPWLGGGLPPHLLFTQLASR